MKFVKETGFADLKMPTQMIAIVMLVAIMMAKAMMMVTIPMSPQPPGPIVMLKMIPNPRAAVIATVPALRLMAGPFYYWL